jgi:septum formation protein
LAEPAAKGRLILASASARRLDLLAQIGVVPDLVLSPEIDETPTREETIRRLVRRLARLKAATVEEPAFVIAADTVVGVGNRILPKAETAEQAAACLALLSGRRHRVYTAVVVRRPDGRLAERLSESVVAFARLSEAQQSGYIASREWHGKAGGYAIQGRAAGFVRFLSGSYSGVVGLPLFETCQLLRGLGWPLP